MRILVGDLSSKVSPDFLQQTFQVYGRITSVSITLDSSTNETIGEVEMPDAIEASNAVESIDGNRIDGEVLTIRNKSEFKNDANPELTSEESMGSGKPVEKRKGNERRENDSPLFKAEKGIVIDRRENANRRTDPDSQNEDAPPLETV